MIDLSNFSFQQLRELEQQVAEQIASRQTQERAKAQQQILALAKSVGLSLEEILNAKVPKQRQRAAVRFQNPQDSSQTWSGRGRQPRWVRAYVEAGNALESLLVQ